MQECYLLPTLLMAPTDMSKDDWLAAEGEKTFGGLRRDLPVNVNVLTLEAWDGNAHEGVGSH